ncbi:hypothetical protein GGS23DRAFT_163530 [Durotheca rogersii]|uniref:uncharacterized protein n=1 Tax=Durotheca rogersii TaxID=419775 RepID=UPI00221FC492|nr:uncharacterized protein GGS23DRAFT_163530 [Durotheca rogersii]KAI5867152.1 hypothetical protein GGS23DRAFT_163530 [Durotheca rogersii]
MAPNVDHRYVILPRNPPILSDVFPPRPLERSRHHDLHDGATKPSSQVSIMSAEDLPLDLSRTLTTGSDGWSNSGDDDESSVTSDTSHARIARRPHFPPVLPSVNSSSSISKSLPQKLAATISAVEGSAISALGQRLPNPSKSQSPSTRFRRLKPPLPPAEALGGSLISSALRTGYPPDPGSPPDQIDVPKSERTRSLPRSVHEAIPAPAGSLATADSSFQSRIWSRLEAGGGVGDDADDQSMPGSFEDDADDDYDEDDYQVPSRASYSLRRLAEQYARLRNKRTTLWEIFDGIRARRTRVRDLRHAKHEANLAFMSAVQAILPSNQELDRLFKDMRDAQFVCQEAEHSFDDMLDELEHGEVELEREERRFYTAAADMDNTASVESDDDTASQTSQNSVLRGISGDRPEDIHPLFEELREAFRNIQLAKELLANTRMKRKAMGTRKSHLLSIGSIELLEQYGDAGRRRALELRQSGLMSEEDIEMLQEYDGLEKRALFDIDRYTEEAKRLEKECREKGVMPKNTPFQQEGFGFNPVHRDDIHLGEGPSGRPAPRQYRKTLAHPIFPKLLYNPTHVLQSPPMTAQQQLRLAVSLPPDTPSRQRYIDDAAREVNIHSILRETGDQDKIGYINRWLLHKLHLSPMEAELLWSTFHVRLKILNVDRWQQDVLHLWWKDQASSLPSAASECLYEDRSSASVSPRADLPSRRHSDSSQLDRLNPCDIEETPS